MDSSSSSSSEYLGYIRAASGAVVSKVGGRGAAGSEFSKSIVCHCFFSLAAFSCLCRLLVPGIVALL